ncbi:hypothetical protein Tco_1579673, partial [Tanacetum coccineum]
DNDVNDIVDHVNEDEWLKESLRKLGRMTKNVMRLVNKLLVVVPSETLTA